MLLIAVFTASGCQEGRYWDEHVYGSITLKLLTFVPCGRWSTFSSPPPEHQQYFHVWSIKEKPSGGHDVHYQAEHRSLIEQVHVVRVHYVGLEHYTIIKEDDSWWFDADARCGELVVLPESGYPGRPFYYPKLEPYRDEARRRTANAAFFGEALGFICLFLWGLSLDGHRFGGTGKAAVSTFAFWLVVLVCVGVFYVSTPGDEADRFVEYYSFFNALPKSEDQLAPLSWAQARRIIQGPPHPAALTPNFTFFYVSCIAGAALWGITSWSAIGVLVYCLFTRDPFSKLRWPNKTPTAEEYLATLTAAAVGKSAWELRILGKRAQLFRDEVFPQTEDEQ